MNELSLLLDALVSNPEQMSWLVLYLVYQLHQVNKGVRENADMAKQISLQVIALDKRVDKVEFHVQDCPVRQLPQIPAN